MSDRPVVLVLDEDPVFLEILHQIAVMDGLHLVPAPSRREALQAVYAGCDLGVINREHGFGLGLEFMAMLKQVRPRVPVLLTSNDSSESTQRQMYAANADLYLPKPVEPQWLRQTVHSLLSFSIRKTRMAMAVQAQPQYQPMAPMYQPAMAASAW